MKNLNVSVSDEAHNRLKIYKVIKGIDNLGNALDRVLLETLPHNDNEED